jgi:hypothetical protein
MTRTALARWLSLLYRSYRAQGLQPGPARAVALVEVNQPAPF